MMFEDDPQQITSEKTSIFLDSLDNEIELIYVNGKPSYYKSEIFTPVCNTGECLPVFVNIYWKLSGAYLRYDQPNEKILTKLDHEPFTEADYRLLDEILRGPDPRFGSSHSRIDRGAKRKNDDRVSRPAPKMSAQIDKHLMVDGISGATLPELRDKFVPGALYTTYTLWGLANDSKSAMRGYTKEHLYTKKFYKHLIVENHLGCRSDVINYMSSSMQGPNPRAQLLMNLLDTGSVELRSVVFQQMYYNYSSLDIVIQALDKLFYGNSQLTTKKNILSQWAYNSCSDITLIKLSENLIKYEALFPEILAVYNNKIEWPEDVVKNMITTYPLLKEKNKDILLLFLQNRMKGLNKDERKMIKSLN